jgi:endonuclease YncB( thermonuclease family)
MHAGQPERVRLWGIDCPESRQAFGREVKVVVRDTGRYGRTVGEVILPDGRSLNHELVRAGLAWWYRQYAANDRTLENLEREARPAKRGLWVEADPTPGAFGYFDHTAFGPINALKVQPAKPMSGMEKNERRRPERSTRRPHKPNI